MNRRKLLKIIPCFFGSPFLLGKATEQKNEPIKKHFVWAKTGNSPVEKIYCSDWEDSLIKFALSRCFYNLRNTAGLIYYGFSQKYHMERSLFFDIIPNDRILIFCKRYDVQPELKNTKASISTLHTTGVLQSPVIHREGNILWAPDLL